MSHNFLFDASFHELLTQIDQDLAKAIQESGCPDCAGNLHQANYPRSPFGLLAVFRVYYNERRKRRTNYMGCHDSIFMFQGSSAS